MKNTLIALFIMLQTFCAQAQLSIGSVNYNTVSLSETNILQAIVINSTGTMNAVATVSCKNAMGQIILEGTTRTFTLNTGTNTVTGANIGFAKFTYGNQPQALYLKNTGMLASGNYTYCLKITPYGNTESVDIFCEEFEASTSDFLNLVSPYDKETLDTKWPVLTWTHSEPFNVLAANEYFKLVVTEIKANQTANQAIYANPVVYSKTFLSTHAIPYPQDAQELQEGKHYAWQVQKISNNIIVNKTDVWEFSLTYKPMLEPMKYVLLTKGINTGVYACVDEHLYFRFDEDYASTGDMRFEIRDDNNKPLNIIFEKDADTKDERKLIKKDGVNKFELDLSKYKLKDGFYKLFIYNEKNETYALKFQVIQ